MGTENQSVTALIPAFFGVPLVVLGALASSSPGARKHAMHAAMVIGLLGFLGAARGLPSLPAVFTNPDEVARPTAVIVQSVMAILCLVYVILGIVSFVKARKAGG